MNEGSVTRFAAMLAALSQPTRLRIVSVVAEGGPAGTPAGQIARAVRCPASTLSFHLKELAQAGLLAAEPQGRFIRYSVVPDAFYALADFVRELPGASPPAEPAPAPRARRKAARKATEPTSGERDEGQMSIFDE